MIQKTNTVFDSKRNVKNVKDLGGEVLESETKEKTYGLLHVIIPTVVLLLLLFVMQYDYSLSLRIGVGLGIVGGLYTGFSFVRNRSKKR